MRHDPRFVRPIARALDETRGISMTTGVRMSIAVLVFSVLGVHALTLTPVWEITRPAEWAPIQYFGIHYDGSGNPLVVCRTDSGVFTVDHTGAQTTIWTFVPGDSALVQRAVLSPAGRYVAIVTNRLEDEEAWTWVADIRVMDAHSTLVWEVTGTPYREIALADEGPWSISTIPEYREEDYWYRDYVIRDSLGVVTAEDSCEYISDVGRSSDGTVFVYSTYDSVYVLDRTGVVLQVEPAQLPGLEGYGQELSRGTPSLGMSVEYYVSLGSPRTGKVVFIDSTGAYGTPIDVAAAWHGDLDISDDGDHAVLGARGILYYVDREPASVRWSVTDPGGYAARSYRSVEITGDGGIAVGCVSRADSTGARLEIYDSVGALLFQEQYPTTGSLFAKILADGAYLAVRRVQLTALGRDMTLVLYQISP